jgi:hypothetical protein
MVEHFSLWLWPGRQTCSPPRSVAISQPPAGTEAYDFVDLAIRVEGADAANPFTDAAVRGWFEKPAAGSASTLTVSAIHPMAACFGSD